MKKPNGEFDLVKAIVRGLRPSPATVLGPGDDCAIVKLASGRQLLTVDSMVEKVHFKLSWFTPEQLGRRALTVNLSDVAAMGGVPAACVVNLGVREGLGSAFFIRLYRGLGAMARETSVAIVGGNITRTPALEITIALLGLSPQAALRRDAARVGYDIFVTGTVGDAAAGLRLLEGKLAARGAARHFLIGRFLNPTARLRAGRQLAKMRPLPAAIDLSDGLWQDLGHILEQSGVGAEIEVKALPLSPAYRAVVGDDPTLALGGGDDYELLFCARPGPSQARWSRYLGVPVRRIGTVVRGRHAVLLDGGRRRPPPRFGGWDQLATRR